MIFYIDNIINSLFLTDLCFGKGVVWYQQNGKKKDLSPRKLGQIKVLLQETSMTQKEIAKKLHVSPQSVCVIKKKEENKVPLVSNRAGNCGRKKNNTQG